MAGEGATILVRPGVYRENIDLLGKHILLTGTDPNDRSGTAYPVIAGVDAGPAVKFIHGEGPACVLSGFVITQGQGSPGGAILCQASSPTVCHCLIVGNRAPDQSGSAVACNDSLAAFIHCTISDNVGGAQGGGMTLVNSSVTLTNSIVWGNSPNQIVANGTSLPSISFTDVAGGWPGLGNLDADPLFADPGHWADVDDPNTPVEPQDQRATWIQGDYHLKSQAGRWDPVSKRWVTDYFTSPCIDAGHPSFDWAKEPSPNGNRINMGAYGGTSQASLSRQQSH